MVNSKQRALESQVLEALRFPASYIAGDFSNGVSVIQLLESITAIPEWSWLSRDSLLECVECSKDLEIVDRFIVAPGVQTDGAVGALHTRPHENPKVDAPIYFPDPDVSVDGYEDGSGLEAYPSPLWIEQLRDRKAAVHINRALVFTTIDSALRASWAISGNLDSAHVSMVLNGAAHRKVVGHPVSEVALFLDAVDQDELVMVPRETLAELVPKVRQSIWLSETLYLDDAGAQALAAKKLFRTGTQRVVETLLLPYLGTDEADVKCNVLNALGMPAYSVGFVPGAPLPPRNERLEHVALAVETIDAILDLSASEADQDVLDAIVCTLSSQPFAATLRPAAKRTEVALLALVPRIQSEQTARDARKIIRELRHLT